MKLIIDGETVTVCAPENLGKLSVEVRGAPAGTAPVEAAPATAALPAGLGRIEGGHAFLDIAELRALARVPGSCTWDERFSQAMEYARQHGWTDDTGGYVRAHVTQPDNTARES